MALMLRRLISVLVVLIPLGLWAATPSALAAGDANQASCPGSTESSPGFRTYLPDCRAYELVTPPYKEDAELAAFGGLGIAGAISADGEHVILIASGAFAGQSNWENTADTVYGLSRTTEGWRPAALAPPASEYPKSGLMAASPADQLATTLWGAETTTVRRGQYIYRREPAGSFVKVGPGDPPDLENAELRNFSVWQLNFAGASNDLNHTLFRIQSHVVNGHSDLWPEDNTKPESESLYEYVGTGKTAPTLVGVSDGSTVVGGVTLAAGRQISRCGTNLGSGTGGIVEPYALDAYNAVSADGETVFFTALACTAPGEPTVDELYARVGESKTVKISEPTTGPTGDCETCNPTTGPGLQNAVFQGASQSGEKVFFLTEQELLGGQKGMNLYEYDFNGSAGQKISLISSGSTEPKVQGVVRVSEDGSHVYFVAKGVLTAENAEGKKPEPEADNLYVYNTVSGGAPVFVGTLMTEALEAQIPGEAVSWVINALGECNGNVSCQAEAFTAYVKELGSLYNPIWQQTDEREAQATPNGRFLLFPSWTQLTPDDTSTVPQLFEYDAEHQKLTRVSIGQSDGGNVSTFRAAPQIPAQSFAGFVGDQPTEAQFQLALTPDGQSVFFTSAAKLTPGAVSGQPSAFEYRGGSVHLISDGRDRSYVGIGQRPAVALYGVAAGTEPAGRDVFFTTEDSLVPQDGESQVSLYDAREAGGFPAPALAPGCLGETCRGVTGMGPQLGGASSAGQAAGGNLAPPTPASKPRSLTRAQKLAKALTACGKQRNPKKRATCKRRAKRRYGSRAKATKKSARRGK
jgi:hypothetical protein